MDNQNNNKLDELGRMIKSGFDGVDKRFDKVDSRLDKVEREVKDLNATLTTQYPDKSFLTQKLAELEERIGKRIDKRFEKEIKFRLKVIEIFRRLNVSKEDISELEQLVEIQAQNYASN